MEKKETELKKIVSNYYYITRSLILDQDRIEYSIARCKTDEKIYTIKTIPINNVEKTKYHLDFDERVEKMGSLKNPNLLNLVEIIETEEDKYLIFENNTYNYIKLLDFMGDTKKISDFNEIKRGHVFMQIFRAIITLHLNEISEIDLDLNNIYINQDNLDIKVLGNIYNHFNYLKMTEKKYGGVLFHPFKDPNYFNRHRPSRPGEKHDSYAGDIWSVGIVFYALLTDKHAYPSGSRVERKNILDVFKDTSQDTISLKKLIGSMLKWEEAERRSIYELIESSWLKKYNLIYNSIKELFFIHKFKNIKRNNFTMEENQKLVENIDKKISENFNPAMGHGYTKTILMPIKKEEISGMILEAIDFSINTLNDKYPSVSFHKVRNNDKIYIIRKNLDDRHDLQTLMIALLSLNTGPENKLLKIKVNLGSIKNFKEFILTILSNSEVIKFVDFSSSFF